MVHSTWTVDDITDFIPMNDTSGDPRVFCLRSPIDGFGMEMVSPSNRASEEFVAATWKSSHMMLAPGGNINGMLFLTRNFVRPSRS